jgi:glycosyltransferase involved in cell wall biosynthesis
MIVRDAERSLGAALASVQPFVDEMVVVDTGSVDGTRKIAEQMGARVLDFVWCDDFSAARNYSLDQATGDWIFWMDADDVLQPASGQTLRRAIAGRPNRDAAFWVVVEEESRNDRGQRRVMGHAHVKLFPRRNDLRFCYRIHEQIAPAIRAADLPILRTMAAVRHVTDRSAAAQAARRERNLQLALLDLAEHPNDPFVFFSLGITYLFMAGQVAKAADYLQQSIAGCAPGSEMQLNAYLFLGQAHATNGQREAEEHVYRQALERFPQDAMLLRRLGDLCAAAGRRDDAIGCYRSIVAGGRVRPSTVHIRGGRMQAALRLGQLLQASGRGDEAAQVWKSFLSKHPEATGIRRALAELTPETKAIPIPTSVTSGQPQNFVVVITAFNVQPFLEGLIQSLAQQRYRRWQAVFVDDASTDGSVGTLRSLLAGYDLEGRFQIVENSNRHYKAYNLFQVIRNSGSPDDIIAIVDGDDRLATDDVFNRLAIPYDQGWEVVWSQWRGSDGRRGTSGALNPFLSPRRQPLVSSHLFTFKRRLFESVTERDLQDDAGKWFQAGCDVALAFPVLDQTIKRKFLPEVLYIYNCANALSHHQTRGATAPLVTALQAQTSSILSARAPKQLVVDQAFLQRHLYELLQAAHLSVEARQRRAIAGPPSRARPAT